MGLGFVGLWFIRKSMAINSLTFQPGPINNVSIVGAAPVLSLSLTAFNTSGADLTVNSLAGAVSSNGALIGNVYNFSPVTIPQNSYASVPVNIALSLSQIVSDLVNAYQTRSLTQNIQLQGWANIEGVQVPLDLQFHVGQ